MGGFSLAFLSQPLMYLKSTPQQEPQVITSPGL